MPITTTVPGDERAPVENPASGLRFADAPVSSPDDVERAVAAAVKVQDEWARVPSDERRSAFLRCGEVLAAHLDEVAELLTLEQGKPLRDTRAEVGLAATWFRHTAGWANRSVRHCRRASSTRCPTAPRSVEP